MPSSPRVQCVVLQVYVMYNSSFMAWGTLCACKVGTRITGFTSVALVSLLTVMCVLLLVFPQVGAGNCFSISVPNLNTATGNDTLICS